MSSAAKGIGRSHSRTWPAALVLAVLALAVASAAFAQTPAPAAISHSHHRRPAHAASKAVAQPAVPVHPPDPPKPDWPALAQANPAEVHFDGSSLSVAASNSSLRQILDEISTATGVKIEGFQTDQRVFGTYGPAPARIVLAQLLQGSGYNILMVGDRGQGTPRQLVLTASGTDSKSAAKPADGPQADNAEDDVVEETEQPEQPGQPIQPGDPGRRPSFPMVPGPGGRTPQEMMQEMQLRQQQLQQSQPIPNPPNPGNPPSE